MKDIYNKLIQVDTCNCNNEKIQIIEDWSKGEKSHMEYYQCPRCKITLWIREIENQACGADTTTSTYSVSLKT